MRHGLELIAVNDEDSVDQIRKFVQKPNYPFEQELAKLGITRRSPNK